MTKLHYAILEQKPQPQARLRPFVLLIGLGVLAATICLASLAFAADCPPGCTCTCDGGNGWANLEIKAPLGGATVRVKTAFTDQDVRLGYAKRLGIPVDAPAQPEHLVYFENANTVRGGGGAPFAGTTVYGTIAGKVGAFKWYAVSALKSPTTCPADTATALHEYGCYALTNAGTTRIDTTWVDQFGAQAGSFGTRPATVCFPANGKPGLPFVCYGDSNNVGPGPGAVCIDTPVSSPTVIETDRYDELCAVALP